MPDEWQDRHINQAERLYFDGLSKLKEKLKDEDERFKEESDQEDTDHDTNKYWDDIDDESAPMNLVFTQPTKKQQVVPLQEDSDVITSTHHDK